MHRAVICDKTTVIKTVDSESVELVTRVGQVYQKLYQALENKSTDLKVVEARNTPDAQLLKESDYHFFSIKISLFPTKGDSFYANFEMDTNTSHDKVNVWFKEKVEQRFSTITCFYVDIGLESFETDVVDTLLTTLQSINGLGLPRDTCLNYLREVLEESKNV